MLDHITPFIWYSEKLNRERWIRKLNNKKNWTFLCAKSVGFYRWIDFLCSWCCCSWQFYVYEFFTVSLSIVVCCARFYVYDTRLMCNAQVCALCVYVLCGILFPWLNNILLSSTFSLLASAKHLKWIVCWAILATEQGNA